MLFPVQFRFQATLPFSALFLAGPCSPSIEHGGDGSPAPGPPPLQLQGDPVPQGGLGQGAEFVILQFALFVYEITGAERVINLVNDDVDGGDDDDDDDDDDYNRDYCY